MTVNAASPEELETLLEDALLLHDDEAVAELFVDGGVLVTGLGSVRSRTEVAKFLGQSDYLAATRSVTVVGDIAVLIGDHTVNVSCRGLDRRWRLVAVVQPQR